MDTGKKYTTKDFQETQKIGQKFAAEILVVDLSQSRHDRGSSIKSGQKSAVVLALSGDLGAGKTTFLQGFASGLGISEVVNSPTFVIMKRFEIKNTLFKNFYHFDLYRLNSKEEILHLGFKEIISNPENIVAIEWSEKLGDLLPKDSISITFKHLKEPSGMVQNNNKRELIINR